MISLEDIEKAQQRIQEYVNSNNIIFADKLSKQTNAKLYLKLENLQRTGSFKIRGAMNAILSLTTQEREMGVVAASAGNHAQGVALACQLTKTKCTIVMPANAPQSKIKATKDLGAEIVLIGSCFDDALAKALELQKTTGARLVHAFDDEHVMAGQGTIGLEIMRQMPDVQNVIVPVGGGGLIAGIATAVKSINPKVKVIGVEAETVNSLSEALNKQHTVLVPANATMADGINVRKIGEYPFAVIEKHVDKVVTVSEEEIAAAVFAITEKQKQVVEGAGAVGLAAIMANKIHLDPKAKTVIVISGGNIDMSILSNVIQHCLIVERRRIELNVIVKDAPGELQRFLNCISGNIDRIEQSRQWGMLKYNTQLVSIVFDVANDEEYYRTLDRIKDENFEIWNCQVSMK